MNLPTMNGRKVPFNPETGEGIAFPTGGKPRKKVGIHPTPQIANTKPLPRQHTRDDSTSTRPSNFKAPPTDGKPQKKVGIHPLPQKAPKWTIKAPDPKAPYGYKTGRRGIWKPRSSHPVKKTDSLVENVLEQVPILGTLLSIDDISRAKEKTKYGTLSEKAAALAPEIIGAMPAGKLLTSATGMATNTVKELAVRHGSTLAGASDTVGDVWQDNVKPAFKKLMTMGK